jgi:hypothetical protein
MVLGSRALWEGLESLDAVLVAEDDLPMLNPLEPRIAARWVWWGSGLGVPEVLMQNAYRAGVKTLPELLRYLQQQDTQPAAIAKAIAVVTLVNGFRRSR